MANPLRSLLQILLGHWHGLCGRVLYRTGNIAASRRHFERVLELRGDVFSAYMYLGRLAWCLGDYSGWRRECEHARRTDPVAFERLRHPYDMFTPRAAGLPLDAAGDRTTWRAVRPATPGPVRRSAQGEKGDGNPGTPTGSEPQTDLDAQHGPRSGDGVDDFSSAVERARFRRLPPIERDAVHAADLDELCRKLTGS